MRTQIKVVSICLLLHCVTSNEISFFKSSNLAHGHARQYKNNILNSGGREPSSSPTTSPIQYMETPNFDIMLLREENSNPTWRKYSELFQPKDLRNAPHIEQLHKPTNNNAAAAAADGRAYNVDPVIDRILALLDDDEQKMLDDLRKSYEKPIYTNVQHPPMTRRRPIVIESQTEASNSRRMMDNHHQEPKSNQIRDLLYKVPCNEGYVFLIESQKNPMNPNALSDLLLRVMKVVTKMA
ncbi:uncharacterized protein LOC129916843 [Episyrphus balteatus]|uniref:uncharacterized protein LOC129916843 n=1 Tax=Episyrphus balteatus TaxID=286459 RepID=UPI0024862AC1|nr:uncharacterized protein LOC129916843 [Episyrphus balteatus]